MEWIKCAERMPDDLELVVVGKTTYKGCVEPIWKGVYWSESGLWCCPNNRRVRLKTEEITHWQPLP